MTRSYPMQKFLDDVFPEQAANKKQGLCATCGGEVNGFRDALSKKEYGISGMCQVCQDEIFT